MFILYKIIAAFILPPGIFVVIFFILFIVAQRLISRLKKYLRDAPRDYKHIVLLNKKLSRFSKISLFCTLFFYLMSIDPVGSFLCQNLEKDFPPMQICDDGLRKADAIVVLGGGINSTAPWSFSSFQGMPSSVAQARLLEAYRVQKFIDQKFQRRVKIIVSGGKVYEKSLSEADIAARYLIELGVSPQDIIKEDKSRTTGENALFSRELCQKYGIKDIILVTSALHMPRANAVFKKIGFYPYLAPCNYQSNKSQFNISKLFPSSVAFDKSCKAIWEYVGLLWYKIKY